MHLFATKNNKVFGFLNLAVFLVFLNVFSLACLITNCPRGGKRSGGKMMTIDTNIKSCIPCGPANSGQCFGPSICCGPFGCLLGTPETLRCQREGQFHESEPCVAGVGYCRKNTGRCAIDGVCCNQDACFVDKQCSLEARRVNGDNMEFFNFMGFQNENGFEKK